RDGMTSVDVEFWWTYMESRIDLFLNRGQLDLALAEFDRMSNVPVGWQHSSSPASYFRSKAADVLLAFLSNNYFGEKSKMDAVIEKLMAMKNGQVRLVKGIVSDQSFDIGRFPKLLDLAVSKGLTDVILNAQYGYSEALLESIKRVADRNGFQDPGEFEYWKKDMKRPGRLAFDPVRRRANQLFGLGLAVAPIEEDRLRAGNAGVGSRGSSSCRISVRH
ncbi:MAG: hypothetical protein KDD43_16830, partial [Bdellovibrionales bacterium]|nr:hypothetical protein [Bdellovibrionales bacterium]